MMRSQCVWGFVVLVVVGLCGCADGESGGDSAPSSPPRPSSPEARDSEELAVEAYEGMWGVYVDASHTGESDPVELERYASDQAEEHIRQTLGERVDAGEVARGEPVLSPEVAEVSDDEVVIDDCIDMSAWVREDAESGELVEEPPEDAVQRRVEATASFDGLAWRVSELLIGQRGSC